MVSPLPDQQSEDLVHAFVINEYKADSITHDMDMSPPPESKIHARHIFSADTDEDRDVWVEHIKAHMEKIRSMSPRLAKEKEKASISRSHSSFFLSRESLGSMNLLSSSTMTLNKKEEPKEAKESKETRVSREVFVDASKEAKDLSAKDGAIVVVKDVQSAFAYKGDRTSMSMSTGTSTQTSPTSPSSPSKAFDDQDRIMETPTPAPITSLISLDNTPAKGDAVKNRKSIRSVFSRKKSIAVSDRKIFGVSLAQAVQLSRIHDLLELPAVIYRSIEYLEHRNGTIFFFYS